MQGTRLGPYELLEPLGAGGMGEVWLAQDTRLGRQVAIKTLPPDFAGDAERLARFEQEARAAAALNHPHIAAVYDVGHEAGGDGAVTHFIVQEHLKGQTLRRALEGGALPLRKALALAVEIAQALGAAHAAGITHRDVKPENVFVTPDGHAKVLDFGLAKLTEPAATSSPDATMSPTLLGTMVGQVLGTAGYMAPEQVDGVQLVDHRADLFAFGTVLYEMVTGRRAFAGRSLADTLSRIQHDEPTAVYEVDAKLPDDLQRILTKTLAKDRDERYQHAADLVVDLKTLGRQVDSGTISSRPAAATGTPAGTGARTTLLAVAASLALAGAAGWWVGSSGTVAVPASGTEEVAFALQLPDEVVELPRGQGSTVTISPDGRKVAFVGLAADGQRSLYLRDLGAVRSERRSDISTAIEPAFSADGQWLSAGSDFMRHFRTPVAGGDGFEICESCFDGRWGDDGRYYFIRNGSLVRRNVDGSGEEVVLAPDPAQGVSYISRPQILPGSRAAIFETGNYERGGVAAGSFEDGRIVLIAEGSSAPLYSTTGHVLYPRETSLFAVPFDAEALEVLGPAEPVLPGVRVENAGALQASISRNGTLVYAPILGEQRPLLVVVDREGSTLQTVGSRRNYSSPRVSPEGERVVVGVTESGRRDIWLIDLQSGTETQITNSDNAQSPAWSPDGTWITYGDVAEDGRFLIRKVDLATSEHTDLYSTEVPVSPTSVHPDGDSILFLEHSANADASIVRASDGTVTQLFRTDWAEDSVTWSPDGTMIVYGSDRTGVQEIYVMDVADRTEVQISSTGGQLPTWTKNGSQVVYRNTADLLFTAATVRRQPRLQIADRRTMFSAAPFWVGRIMPGYDPTADGGLVGVRHRDPDDPADEIHVILNFAARLSALGAGSRP